MKELWRKKRVKVSVLMICVLVTGAIAGITIRSISRQNMFSAHVETAQKYLSELDYEQAIAEYRAAMSIEPDSQAVLDALEQLYLDMAQEKIDAEAYSEAIRILEQGYEEIHRSKLLDKKKEVEQLLKRWEEEKEHLSAEEQRKAEVIQFSFELSDFAIMGFDIQEDHLRELIDKIETFPRSGKLYELGAGWYGHNMQNKRALLQREDKLANINYAGNFITFSMEVGDGNDLSHIDMSGISSYPVKAGDTYDLWCNIMQVNRIRNSGVAEYKDEKHERYIFNSNMGKGWYIEREVLNSKTYARLVVDKKTDIYEIWAMFTEQNFIEYLVVKRSSEYEISQNLEKALEEYDSDPDNEIGLYSYIDCCLDYADCCAEKGDYETAVSVLTEGYKKSNSTWLIEKANEYGKAQQNFKLFE